MLTHQFIRDENGKILRVETSLTGKQLLSNNRLNKECAFTQEERERLELTGKLPYHVETLEDQVARTYRQYCEIEEPLEKNVFLNHIFDVNATLFYRVAQEHLEEMLPIIYTPTIGEAVQNYSLEHRASRGIFIAYPDQDRMEEIIEHRNNRTVDLIVVTDGERVLGIGDQGVGGIDIPIGKLMVYTLCAGINPLRVLPIQLDVGTNNEKLLNDPMYLGWRHQRISGEAYDEFIRKFIHTIKKKLPGVYLHWEDFGRENARKNLETYREKICSFNDDMQGTGIVALACVLSAVQATGEKLTDQHVVILGGGTAGCGIADQIHAAMVREGLSSEKAYRQFYVVDRDGLLTADMPLLDFQRPYAREASEVSAWKINNTITLETVIKQVKPMVLVGVSTAANAFTESIVKEMASHHKHPIILPLSNPTSKSEAIPEDLIKWTEGRALIACGSPFPPVLYKGKQIRISQSNNALCYPGLGLGVLISKATRVSDDMLWAACKTLTSFSPAKTDPSKPLLPDFSNILQKSRAIAKAVATQAIQEGLAQIDSQTNLDKMMDAIIWEPRYYPYYKMTKTSTPSANDHA